MDHSKHFADVELVHTPWMHTFLRHVADTKEEILLISPFIKLSLVRPLIMALPDTGVRIEVVTRCSPQTFIQGASDALALKLLQDRPVAKGPTELFKMNRLHAKVYIFDRRRILLGSSNLSYSGFERNFEMAVYWDDPARAAHIIGIFAHNDAFNTPVSRDDMSALLVLRETATTRQLAGAYAENDAQQTISLAPDLSEDDQDTQKKFEFEEPESEESPISFQNDSRRRLRIINDYAWEQNKTVLNSPSGQIFEFVSLYMARDKEIQPSEGVKENLRKALVADINLIEREVVPKLQLPSTQATKEALIGLFIAPNLIETFSLFTSVNGNFYRILPSLGKKIVRFLLKFHFSKKIDLTPEGAAKAVVAADNLVADLDFGTSLRERGLFIRLHINVLSRKFEQEICFTLIGGVALIGGLEKALCFALNLIGEQISLAQIDSAELSPKTLLQVTAQKLGASLVYKTERIGGAEHEPIFTCVVSFGMRSFAEVQGKSKKEAESSAAKQALNILKSEPEKSKVIGEVFSALGRPSKTNSAYKLDPKRRKACLDVVNELGLPSTTKLSLVDIALTHRSLIRNRPESRSNEKLCMWGAGLIEIVGDYHSYLRKGFLLSLDRNTLAAPGRILSEALEIMFDRKRLRRFVATSDNLVLESGEFKKDVVQALAAVAYLTAGIEGVQAFYIDNLAAVVKDIEGSSDYQDSTTLLQEMACKMGIGMPEYYLREESTSPKNSVIFLCQCKLGDRHSAEGHGASKKQARQDAAAKLLRKIQREPE